MVADKGGRPPDLQPPLSDALGQMSWNASVLSFRAQMWNESEEAPCLVEALVMLYE